MDGENAPAEPKKAKAKLDAKGRPLAEKPDEDTKRDKAGRVAKQLVRMGVFVLLSLQGAA